MPRTHQTILITGVGRRQGIAAAIALGLAADGYDLVVNHWAPYDDRLDLERGADDPSDIADECRELGVQVRVVSGDLADVDVPARLVAEAADLGPLRGMVLSHCESIDSHTLDTTIEAWDRHFAVNARASWLLIKALAAYLPAEPTPDAALRVVALTSDHVAFNLPYGSSKGALDRLVAGAGLELASRGLRANLINPGPIDTGWMDDEIRATCLSKTAAGRLGTPNDIAGLVRFLMSDLGGWTNGQVLYCDGGWNPG